MYTSLEKLDFQMCVHLFLSMKMPENFRKEVVAERDAALKNNSNNNNKICCMKMTMWTTMQKAMLQFNTPKRKRAQNFLYIL